MEQCESKTMYVCKQPATWRQTVQVGNRVDGRFLYYSYWCDEHAEVVAQRRRRDHLTPPMMVRLAPEAT